MSIWLIVLLALFLGSAYGIYFFSRRVPPSGDISTGPAGVGGWLLLLVTGLMILGPLMGAARLSSDLTSAEALYPFLKNIDEWKTYKSVSWLSFLVVCCLSFYAGIGLSRGRNVRVVKRARVLLWVIGPIATMVLGLIIPMMMYGDMALKVLNSGFVGSFLSSIIIALIWTIYLSRSKRVKATYGVGSSTADG